MAPSESLDTTKSSDPATLVMTPKTLEACPSGSTQPQMLHQVILLIGKNLEDLVALNQLVTLSSQLDVLWDIHIKLYNLMARPYHK